VHLRRRDLHAVVLDDLEDRIPGDKAAFPIHALRQEISGGYAPCEGSSTSLE